MLLFLRIEGHNHRFSCPGMAWAFIRASQGILSGFCLVRHLLSLITPGGPMRVPTHLVLAALFMLGTALPAPAQLGRLRGAISGAVENKANQRLDAEIQKLAERVVD